jgi:tripartite-type tricarboxylate transporter receptor subunit TctC
VNPPRRRLSHSNPHLVPRFVLHWVARVVAALVAGLLSTVLSGHAVSAQPTRAIKVVVAVPAGGPADIVAHLFADQVSQALGQARGPTIEIVTRTTGDGSVGAEDVARAAPNGDTVLLTTNAFIINPYIRQVFYDPLTSFEPVCYLARSPELFVVHSASGYHTLADLLSAARANPRGLAMASFGPGGSAHIGIEMLKLAAKVDLNYVPYSSQVSAINALLDDRVASAFISYAGVSGQLKAGNLRALATASRQRIEALPDVPTVAESGYQDFETEVRVLLLAPARTPKEAVTQLAGSFTGALAAPEVKSKLVLQGLYPVGLCGADFADYLRKQFVEYGRVVRDAKIR